MKIEIQKSTNDCFFTSFLSVYTRMNVIWHQGGNLRGAEHNPTNYFVILGLVQLNCGQLTTNPGTEAEVS